MAPASPETVTAEPRFEALAGLTIVGLGMPMTPAAIESTELWPRFMPTRQDIRHRLDKNLHFEVLPPGYRPDDRECGGRSLDSGQAAGV